MQQINLITRRGFLDRNFKIGLGVALSTLTDLPIVVKRALAEGNIGLSGKKLLFIFLRGANDALNTVIPAQDPAYSSSNRPTIGILRDAINYGTTGQADFPENTVGTDATFKYANAIRLGNGFAAMHPSMKFLAPVYNGGDLALIHRVGYPRQSRSHFDSQNYWETGTPNNNLTTNGIFYRTMIESGLTNTNSLTGVSIQSALPLSLRGSAAAMTNLTDPLRYDLLGIPNNTAGNTKSDAYLRGANNYPFADKMDRGLLNSQYQNLSKTLQTFAAMNFTDAGNTFVDNTAVDGEASPYYLFPTSNAKNGGYAQHASDTSKYVVDTGAYSFFTSIKAAALILNNTDAVIAGTEMGGFDTHNVQGAATGTHANLLRRVSWALYGLRKYFQIYGRGGTSPSPGALASWNDIVVVTLTEFGRTTVENTSQGTDHAEAGVSLVAGGAVRGYNKTPGRSGVVGCHTGDAVPWVPGTATGTTGTMFGASGRYLQRAFDYRSILGEIIRNHLGATQNQLNRIIPGYTDPNEFLQAGGKSGIDGVNIIGEPGLV